MFEHILVGVDGRNGGRDAIALAGRLAEADSRITLGHAFMADDFIHTDVHGRPQGQDTIALLENERAAAGIEAELRYIKSRTVGAGLHRLAEDEHANLLVVGSSRRGLLGRVLMTDETREALRGAPCAVAVAPAGYLETSAPIRAIGVGFDGSTESRHALTLGEALAAELGARLSAYNAVMVPVTTIGPGRLPLSDVIDPLVEQALAEITREGVEAHAGYGPANERLTEYSAGLDLLIIGSRGQGPIGRLVHGSTGHALAATARCPLLVVPRAGERVRSDLDRQPVDTVSTTTRRADM